MIPISTHLTCDQDLPRDCGKNDCRQLFHINPVRDYRRRSDMVAESHELTDPMDLEGQEVTGPY